VIDCDGRDTSCRDFSDITANRCEGAGDCKDPNTTDCVAFVDVAAGTNCGLCAACDGAGTCGMTPADDAACGEIDCDGLDTICRDYDDLIANRCEAFGDCADPNTADCIAYSDTSTGTYCGLCSSCDGAGSCSLALSDDDACGVIDCDGGDTPCRDYADLTDDRCDGAGACKEPNGAGCSTFDNAPAGSSCAPCGACDGTGDCKAIADGTSCENALFCSLEDTCIGGECTAGAARNCYDSNPCTADTCSEADGECQHESLSDGGTCSTGTVCGGQCLDGQCQGGTPVDCEDDTACTVDTCNPTTLECINSPVPDGTGCDDGDPTTTDDVCLAGLCAGTSDEPDAGVGGERERGGCGCSTRGKPTQVGWLPLLALAWFLRRSRCPRTSRNRRALGGNPRT
jgi:MYXO-CTERM domain-containing protein